jgi:hypothetical protein
MGHSLRLKLVFTFSLHTYFGEEMLEPSLSGYRCRSEDDSES